MKLTQSLSLYRLPIPSGVKSIHYDLKPFILVVAFYFYQMINVHLKRKKKDTGD